MVDAMTRPPWERPPNDYWAHVAHHRRNERDVLVAYEFPRGGIGLDALLDRPPFRRLAGRRATLSGRGRRRSQTPEAIAARKALVLKAWALRTRCGWSIREIAREVDRSPSLVGRWMLGIPAAGGNTLDALERDVAHLAAQVDRAGGPVRS
jgi:hypothetical protein